MSVPRGESDRVWEMMGRLFKTHPWHGVRPGPEAPDVVTVYVEIVPSDTVKYEVDKVTGHLKVDRPQQFSNVCPALYGFVPQTYSGDRVAELARRRTGRHALEGDGDPLDICVLSEKSFSHGDFLLRAVPIGGLRVIDSAEADDKLVAVLEGDVAYGQIGDLAALPAPLVERLEHYFLTYKLAPGSANAAGAAGTPGPPSTAPREVVLAGTYGRDEAREVIRRAMDDYHARFPDLRQHLLAELRGGHG